MMGDWALSLGQRLSLPSRIEAWLIGLWLLLLFAVNSPARSGVLHTRDGRTLEGDIQLTNGAFVIATNRVGGATSQVQVPLAGLVQLKFDASVPSPAGTVRGKGNGLLGYYFANTNATGDVVVRLDQTVDFDWGTAVPVRGVPPDGFSVTWMGEVEAPAGGPFTFCIGTDDGGRLFVDNRLLCESWRRQESAETNGTLTLEAGKRYPVRFDYFDFSGNARTRLLWSGPDTPKGVIPKDRLHAASRLPDHTASVTGERGLLATYYRNSDFTGPTFTRIDPVIDLSGTEGALAPSFSPNSCSVRWAGQVRVPASEIYTFHLLTDEPARLWMDQQLLIDRTESELGESKESVPLKAGECYDVQVEARNTGGGLVVRLFWSSTSIAKEIIPPLRLTPSRPTPSGNISIEGTITVPPGIVLRNGTFIAGTVEGATDTTVRISGMLKDRPISTINVARIHCQATPQNLLQRVPAGRSGALLAKGDFLDGEFRGLNAERLLLSSVLFGPRSFDARKEVLAVVLREVVPLPDQFEIQTRDNSVLRVQTASVEPGVLTIQDPILGRLSIPAGELMGIRGR